MNAKRRHSTTKPVGLTGPIWFLILALASLAHADPAAQAIREGNALYAEGQFTEAINKYNEALVEQPAAVEPKFNKANGYYRLDDLGEAIDLYREVAAESKDMTLVAKAKYNLGNCLFQQGTKQRDSDLQKALEDMEASIDSWRGVLDIDPDNVRAAENIEVARLTIKDILDQIKQQQEQQQQNQQSQQDQQNQQQQDQQQDQQQGQGQSQEQQDQGQQQDQQSQSQDSESEQDQSGSQQDQQQSAEQDQQQEQASAQEQQGQSDQQQNEAQQLEQQEAPDARAQRILDKEQRDKEQRQILQRRQAPAVEKDW